MKSNREKILFYIGLFVCALILFGGIYGFSMLDPANISYVYNNYDTEQHYFGWVAYRDADWRFPIGLHDRLIYPDVTSVIFTDSIPILAFIFKLFSPILPETFQYFGLWTLFCMFLSGVFTSLILYIFSDRVGRVFLSSVLMMIVPTVMIRAFAHEALGAQWMVLFALWIFCGVFGKKDDTGYLGLLVKTVLLGFLAGSIHIYFIPICGMVMLGCAVYMILADKKPVQAVFMIAAYIGSAAVAIFLWGGFSVDLPSGNDDYVVGNAANLNTLFNPLDHSLFFSALPISYQGQDDGYGYLGLGFMAAVAVAVCILVVKSLRQKKQSDTPMCGDTKAFVISLCVMFLAVLWFSTYPIISFGSRVFVQYSLPSPINDIMAAFRCNGRGIWVITYTIMILALIAICRAPVSGAGQRLLAGFLVLCIVLQIADLTPLIREKYTYCNEPRIVENPLTASQNMQEALATGRYGHVFMDESLLWAETSTLFATENHLTTNRYYLARQNEEANRRRNEEGKKNLSSDTFYIFSVDAVDEMESLGLNIIYHDDYIYVGVTE